jgi:hypothetical protein
MAEYLVTWEINLNAESPLEAARKALTIHRDPKSTATVFVVTDEEGETKQIDLEEEGYVSIEKLLLASSKRREKDEKALAKLGPSAEDPKEVDHARS